MNILNNKQQELKPEDIKQALASLSVQERASLLLTVSGFTPEEVTEVLNTEPQHFSSRISTKAAEHL